MIKEKDLNIFSCTLKKEYLNNIKFPIKAQDLMDQVFDDNRIENKTKQFIYLLMKAHHKKEFNTRILNRYGYAWDWFDTGDTIYDCNYIVNSDNIFKSDSIKYSKYVNRSRYCDHLLFCNDLNSKSYMAFNKHVESTRWKQLANMSLTELRKQPEFDARLYKLLRTIRKKVRKGESHNEY